MSQAKTLRLSYFSERGTAVLPVPQPISNREEDGFEATISESLSKANER